MEEHSQINRFVFHVDVNSAFLSWEAVKELKNGATLDLRTVPAVIGGDAKTRHGIVCAKSMPCKEYGIQTAEPVSRALQKCPNLIVRPGDFKWYGECSRAFLEICEEFSPEVEQFSIDECFMEMTGFLDHNTRECAVQTADRLRETIEKRLGFTVNIGVAENKLLAKMASDFRKPNRTHTLWADEIATKMWPLPVRDLLFVGRSTESLLLKLGIKTIGELASFPERILKLHMTENAALSLQERANGIDDSIVITDPDDEKSYSNEFTVPHDLTRMEDVAPVLLHIADKVAARMRRDKVKAGLVTAIYKNCNFESFAHQRKLDYHTYAADLIYREALRLFDELWDHVTPVRLVGISCGNLTKEGEEQMHLFVQEEKEKKERLGRMIDEIKDIYGEDAIQRATEMKPKGKKNP